MLNSSQYWIVVVLYEPDQSSLDFWLPVAQQHNVVIVDNSPVYSVSQDLERVAGKVFYNHNQGGIAGALNIGLTYVSNTKADWCFLFDQDSRPEQDFFSKMLKQIAVAEDHHKTALFAPVYYETNLQKIADVIEITNGKLNRHKYRDIKNLDIVNATYTITSGSVINLSAWGVIGNYDESLFLDFVDIEWGMRASSVGYKVIVFPKIIMQHTLGDNPIRFFFFSFPCHSTIRHFYYFRNAIYMLRLKHVPLIWKCYELIKFPIRFAVYGLFTRNKRKHVKAMSAGIWHGITRKED
ncbi:glycosyltransferase family 2 protein [Vibrio porteresiae]|uniref:Glycosyltransferase family 2 protein n=1 Tax=Vibrio porteresiae DSM 19223 TaxID=1123496 RepID=A0ABZ0QEI0_9VIBR|nr:glycosyltransferase family 2 protein [Vibrio porteresiae]WPC74280.1 glycosyltransferase family 2 protein [Vibrio porteresiae DSM 19223]